MSKDEILKYFSDLNAVYNDSSRLDTLSKMLDELVADAAPRWVRVEDELPDIAVKVVAYAEGQIITAWRTLFSEPIGQWDTYDAVRIDNITHWMPLPEPPKDKP